MDSIDRYTGGEWQRNIPPASKYPVIYAGRNTHVCVLSSRPEGEMEGNADLIVAAPKVLRALRALVSRVEYYAGLESRGEPNCEGWTYTNDSTDMDNAREAIRLAEGGRP